MANNQYVNKVVFGNDTLIDLSGDTVYVGALLSGYTAHDASGAPINGGIQYRTGLDLVLGFENNGTYGITVPFGCYSQGTLMVPGIKMSIPASGTTNSFYIDFPNNSAPVSENDWTRVTFSVDSNGDSNISSVAIAANGVSF